MPPGPVLRIYLLAWAPILLVYMVAVETDGVWSRGFNLWSALHGTLRNLGPQLALFLLLWPLTGWMAERRMRLPTQMLVHAVASVLLALAYYVVLWSWIALQFGVEAAEKARQNWFIWQLLFCMLGYAAAAGGFHAYRAVQRAIEQAAATAQAQSLLARAELAALRNRLNPHFLFNTLHSILALVRKDAKRAEAALFQFSEMLRYILDTERAHGADGADQVLLRDEMAFTEQYLQLEGIRLGERLQVDWQMDDAALSTPVPALCIQPLVENAIHHAFNVRSSPGRLQVLVQRQDARVRVVIADDGPGVQLPEGGLPQGQGLGLSTVARRIALVYGDRAQMSVVSSPGAGFSVTLDLPLQA
jgi:signal transduction histidine kinase